MTKNYKTYILVVIAIAALAGVVWIARPDSQTPKDPPMGGPTGQASNAASSSSNSSGILKAEESNFDFGSISMAAGKVSHSFKIKNTGKGPVNVEKMYASCMCTTAALTINGEKFGPYGMPGHGFIPKINEMLNIGEEAIVEVVFNPAAHGPAGIGKIQRAVYLENDSGSPLELGIQATVTP